VRIEVAHSMLLSISEAMMNNRKKTSSDRHGARKSKRVKQPARESSGASWSPDQDVYGGATAPVDLDLDLDRGRSSTPPPKSTP